MPTSTSTANEEAVSILCDNCHNPVTKAAEPTADLSWTEAVQNVVITQLARPQMWPFGYILGSRYSPFRLELEMPQHHWRDAFEDLLALDSGRGLISVESRKRETDTAATLRFDRASESISRVNELLKRDASLLQKAEKVRDSAEANGDEEIAKAYLQQADALSFQALYRHKFAQSIEESFKASEGQTGSQHKARGHWMASLLTSGAVKGWYARLSNSEQGECWAVGKVDDEAPGENVSNFMTDEEMRNHFEQGVPYEIASPGPALDERDQGPRTAIGLPPLGFRAQIFRKSNQNEHGGIIKDSDSERFSPKSTYLHAPLNPAVRTQFIRAESINYPGGTIGVKALLRTEFMNDTTEEREVRDDPASVLREVEKARVSIDDRNLGW